MQTDSRFNAHAATQSSQSAQCGFPIRTTFLLGARIRLDVMDFSALGSDIGTFGFQIIGTMIRGVRQLTFPKTPVVVSSNLSLVVLLRTRFGHLCLQVFSRYKVIPLPRHDEGTILSYRCTQKSRSNDQFLQTLDEPCASVHDRFHPRPEQQTHHYPAHRHVHRVRSRSHE